MRKFLGALAALLSAQLVGVPIATAAAQAKPVLTWANATAPSNFNPAIEINYPLLALCYSSILHIEADGTIGPGLAVSWHYVGQGNQTFEFTLRQNARFSDGTPVTAAAVKTWIEYFPTANGPFAGYIPFKSIQTIGQWTVVIHLKTPVPDMPFYLAEPEETGFIASPKAAADPKMLNDATDGSGPYELVPSESVAQDHYTFVPNPYYYDPSAVHFSKIIYRNITQPTSMLAAVETGQVEVGYGDLSTVKAAAAAGLKIVSAPVGWLGLLLLDRAKLEPDGKTPNPLNKVAVRQALNYAINRQAVTSAILGSYGKPTSELVTLDGWDPSYQNYYPYDPAKAKALLASAGYPNGFTINVLSQTFFGTLGDPFTQAMAKYLSAVGVQMNITEGPTLNEYLPKYLGGGYEATGFLEAPTISMFNTYNDWFKPGDYGDQHGWDDPVLDSLWRAGLTASDPGQYAKAMVRRIVTQADQVVVSTNNQFWYVAKGIGGVEFSSASGQPFPSEWYPQ